MQRSLLHDYPRLNFLPGTVDPLEGALCMPDTLQVHRAHRSSAAARVSDSLI